ncbi:MAG: hypothetical protein ACFCUI_00515 [Bernardetiaceae bacterium]
MHNIAPFHRWEQHYQAHRDARSPFFERQLPEVMHHIYGYYIHPEWEHIGSETLYVKLLYVDYTRRFCFLELIGEWNDALHNDIMYLRCQVVDQLLQNGITRFILIGENVLNFHGSDDCYYEDWFEELPEDGWIVAMNFRHFVLDEMSRYNLDMYLLFGGRFDQINWRTLEPLVLFRALEKEVTKRLN